MQHVREHLQAVDDPGAGSAEIGVCVRHVNVTLAYRAKTFPLGFACERCRLAQRPLHSEAAAREQHRVGIGALDLLPSDAAGGLALASDRVDTTGELHELRVPVATAVRWVDPL